MSKLGDLVNDLKVDRDKFYKEYDSLSKDLDKLYDRVADLDKLYIKSKFEENFGLWKDINKAINEFQYEYKWVQDNKDSIE